MVWVGFEMLHSARKLCISQRRADWFTKWTSEVAASRTCTHEVIRGGSGPGQVCSGCAGVWEALPVSSPQVHRLFTHATRSRQYLQSVSLFLRHLCPSSFRNPGTMTVQLSSIHLSCPPESTHKRAQRELVSAGGSRNVGQTVKLTLVAPSGFSMEVTTGGVAVGIREKLETITCQFPRWKP